MYALLNVRGIYGTSSLQWLYYNIGWGGGTSNLLTCLQCGIVIVVPEEEETEEDSKPSEQFEPVELNGVWLTFIIKKLNGYLMSDF